MTKEIKITSSREGIMTLNDSELTIITDQAIDEGDVLHSELHMRKEPREPINLHVDKIIEKRPSRGNWKKQPPMWMRIKYHRS